MNRLPSYDYKHNQAEKVTLVLLQLVAFALVALAVGNGAEFCVRRDQICQALSSNLLANVESSTKSPTKEPAQLQINGSQQTAGAPHPASPRS